MHGPCGVTTTEYNFQNIAIVIIFMNDGVDSALVASLHEQFHYRKYKLEPAYGNQASGNIGIGKTNACGIDPLRQKH